MCFNSLFEMPKRTGPGDERDNHQTVSILYLRCAKRLAAMAKVVHVAKRFNSLFEMRVGVRRLSHLAPPPVSILYLRCRSWLQ